jgi:hypothetical protein
MGYKQTYLKYFRYGEQDIVPCEICQSPAVDIHHIWGRGKDKDVIENLMAVCRKCHVRIHDKEMFRKEELQLIHNYKLSGHPKIFVK